MSVQQVDRHYYTRPRSSKFHLFHDKSEHFALNVETGRILQIPVVHANTLETMLDLDDPARANAIMLSLGLGTMELDKVNPPQNVPVKALSLAVAQKCNLGCTYCYAQQGTFGEKSRHMSTDVARASVDQLLEGAIPGENITIAFMGGEPLTNRKTLHATTRYAADTAADRGVNIGFTMTTNATLLSQEDVDLFQKYGFTLTVSIDGLGSVNDQLRPFLSGKGSFDRVAKNINTLLANTRRSYRVLARVTVTPKNLDLPEIMAGLLDMGVDSVMFSPMLSAPSGKEQMTDTDLEKLLEQLIECGELFRRKLQQGQLLQFSNMIKTLQRIHSYKRDQYPCGAGGGYMGVSSKGELYACHRFINDDVGHMGNVYSGVDLHKQSQWLNDRNLHKQSPCTVCWARYLCSGSCHYEVIKRGRPACDYIRGWLHYCLTIYTALSRDQPEILANILNQN